MLQRHNLYLYKINTYDAIPCLDIGKTVATALQAQEATQNRCDIAVLLAAQISANAVLHNKTLQILRLQNIAILCEPMLDISATNFLLEQSRHCILLLDWDGAVSADKTTLYWANSAEAALHFPIALAFFA
jgi:hypothetical protein